MINQSKTARWHFEKTRDGIKMSLVFEATMSTTVAQSVVKDLEKTGYTQEGVHPATLLASFAGSEAKLRAIQEGLVVVLSTPL